MSNDKLPRFYALFLRFSRRPIALTLPQQAIALFLKFSAKRSLSF
ncbi:MAG: hypothetical protein V7L02_27135 [Nostoc sp.]